MDKEKEIRLNASKRQALIKDFRKHCESKDTPEKEAFKQARENADSAIASAFAVAKEVVERRFPLEDVATLQELQRKHNTIDVIGKDSCFFMNAEDTKVLDQYNDEVDKKKHFSFELDGAIDGGYGRYNGGNHSSGRDFAYAYYREEMKAVGLNPDCNIEANVKSEGNTTTNSYNSRSNSNNPYVSQCRNSNDTFLNGRDGGNQNYMEMWKDKHSLYIIGSGGCRSRAIPCSDLEFQKFEMMIQAKQDLVQKHTTWIESVLAQVKRFEQGVKEMTKFSQVEKFASHKKIQWNISKDVLGSSIGMDIVVSIDDLADAIDNITRPKQDNRETILAWKKAMGKVAN